MNFDDEYKKIFSDKKLSDDFISSLSEEMAKEAVSCQKNISISEKESNIETPVIKKSSENIFVIFKKVSVAAVFAGAVLGISVFTAININNISTSKKGNIIFHDSKGSLAEVTTTSKQTDPESTAVTSVSQNSIISENNSLPEGSSVPDAVINSDNKASKTASESVSSASSSSDTAVTTANDGIVRWPKEHERQAGSLVEFGFSNETVDINSSDRTVEVDMNIGKNTGFTAFIFCIQYDKSALNLKKVVSNLPKSASDKTAKVPDLEHTRITNKSYDTICFFNPESAVFHPVTKEDFTCCRLVFEIKPNAKPGKYIINRIAPDKTETELINVLDGSHNVVKPDFSFKSGSITICDNDITSDTVNKKNNKPEKKSEK